MSCLQNLCSNTGRFLINILTQYFCISLVLRQLWIHCRKVFISLRNLFRIVVVRMSEVTWKFREYFGSIKTNLHFTQLDYPELNIPKLDPYTSESPFVINLRRASLPVNFVANCSNISIHGLDKIEIIQMKCVFEYKYSFIYSRFHCHS